MATSFYIGNDMESAASNGQFVHLSEEVLTFLCITSEQIRPKADVLLELDPYGDKIIENEHIKEIIEICELIFETYEEAEVKEFANELRLLCKDAINNGFTLYALGD